MFCMSMLSITLILNDFSTRKNHFKPLICSRWKHVQTGAENYVSFFAEEHIAPEMRRNLGI